MSTVYVFDTSAFSNWWSQRLPPDIFEGVWELLEALIDKGRLTSNKVVEAELQGSDESLLEWIGKQENLEFSYPCAQVQRVVGELGRRFPQLQDQTRLDADPWVVGQASANGFVVVSNESRADMARSNKIKIPNLCDVLGVQHCDFFEFARAEGLKLRR